MAFRDPYAQDPTTQGRSLMQMLGLSVGLHILAVVGFVFLGGARLLANHTPPIPPKVYKVELVAMAPMAEKPKALPDKVTAKPRPQPKEPGEMTVPTEDPQPPKPEEPKPEPKPKEPPKPSKVEAKPQDSIASLKDLFKNRQAKPTAEPKPKAAAPGPKDRPPVPQVKGPDTRGLGDATTYAADTPEGRYIAQIKAKIINVWSFPPRLKREASELKVLVEVQLTPSGRMVNPTLFKPSGNETIDQSALRAVSMIAAREVFPNPPDSLQGETFQFAFSPKEGK